jgi:hypothetical protein
VKNHRGRGAIAIGAALVTGAALGACGSPQFAPRNEHGVTAPAPGESARPPASRTTSTTPISAPPAASTSSSAAKAAPSKIIARHVLVQWMGCKRADSNIVRSKDQARAVAQDVLRRLKAGEDFARVVLDFSDEPGAGRRGGSLPPFGRGTMDKAFEDAAFALAPGELSGIVESEFGFHVIQRLE